MIAVVSLALYFVLALAAQNGRESVGVTDLAIPVGTSLIFAGLTVVVGRWGTRDDGRATLVALALVTSFACFGRLAESLAGWSGRPLEVVSDTLLALMWLPPIGVLLATRIYRGSVNALARYATLVSGILLTIASSQLILQSISGRGVLESVEHPSTIRVASGGQKPPDIYLLVLDKYSGSAALQEHYGFDNQPFEDFLRQRGFVVPPAARANYVHTFLAIASLLNVRYLDELPSQLGMSASSRRPVDPLVERNWVMEFLKAQGYRTVFFPTAFPTTRRNRFADLQIPTPERIRPEFVTGWLLSTPLPAMQGAFCDLFGCTVDRTSFVPEAAALLDWKFGQLERLAGGERPLFVFMHVMLPHEPYIYKSDCRHRRPFWPLRDDGPDSAYVKQSYLEQIQCLNRKLQHLVTVLKSKSPRPPVILLQGDHGHGRLSRKVGEYRSVPANQKDERGSVFAAYLVPGGKASEFSDSITPINAMRAILRQYFGAKLPPLPDVTYWSSTDEPYRYIPHTD